MTDGKVAVVGGTGYLGSHIVLMLLDAGYEPVVVTRHPEKLAELLPCVHVEARRADVTESDDLGAALKGCTYVHSTVALLNQVFHSPFPKVEEETIRTNVEGTRNVLRAAHEAGARRMILTSSCSTRYTRNGDVASEDSPRTDLDVVNDAYVKSKLRAEEVTADFRRRTGLSVVSILPGALVGPGDRSRALLNGSVLERLNGINTPSIEGGFPVVDVRDVARTHVAAMEKESPAQDYLVVADTISSRDWNNLVTCLTGLPPLRQFLSPRLAFAFARFAETIARLRKKTPMVTRNQVQHVVQSQRYDCSRVRRELGLEFTSIEVAVRDMIQWFVDNGFVAHPERITLAPVASE